MKETGRKRETGKVEGKKLVVNEKVWVKKWKEENYQRQWKDKNRRNKTGKREKVKLEWKKMVEKEKKEG